jgi:protocatechuate 3,4-dioxygenase beta subunit
MNDSRRGWRLAFLVSSALLIVPLVVWFLLPNHGPLPPKTPRPRPTPVATVEQRSAPSAARAPAPRPAVTKPNEDAPGEEFVVGSVVDPEGQPVSAAFVGCDDRSSHLTTSTDSEGQFRLPVEASGCQVVAHHTQFPASDRTRIETGKVNVVKLGAGGTLEGVVVDDQNRPIASYRLTVEVFLPKVEGGEIGIRGRPRQISDESGAFRLERMPAGKYVLVASAPGQPPGKSDSVEVDVGQTARNVRIVLPRPATLSGTIRDEDSQQPVAGAVVNIDGYFGSGGPGGPNANAAATSDDQGNYSLLGVPPGPFSVRVEHGSYKTRIVTGLTTRGSSSIREDISVKARGDGGAERELEGIGAGLAPSPGGPVVVSLVEAGPALNAGIKKGDKFVRIDGTSTAELPLSEVIERLRGPRGSRVSISIVRDGGTNLELTLVRARIDW